MKIIINQSYRKGKEDDEYAINDGADRRTKCNQKIGGKEETRRFLENLGFVTGGMVTVVSEIGGNMIVNVKDSRVAIGKDMANKILV